MADYETELPVTGDISAAVVTPAEPAKRERKCSVCGSTEHTARTCPEGAVTRIRRTTERARNEPVADWTSDDIMVIGTCVATVLLVGSRMVETGLHIGRIRMESEEADAIGKAASRIALRRLRVPGAKKGDVLDVVIIATTLTAYIMRIGELTYSETVSRNGHAVNRNGTVQPEQRTADGYVRADFTGGYKPEGRERAG